MPKLNYHIIKHLFRNSIGCLVLLFVASCKKEHIPEYHTDGEVIQLFTGSDLGKTKVNVVILGDAYTKDDLTKGGVFDKQINAVAKYLFTIPPYSTYQEYFKVSAVYAESKNRGAGIGESDTGRTKFSTYFDTITTRALLPYNYDQVNRYAAKAFPNGHVNLIILLVNDQTYGGTGGGIATVSTGDGYLQTIIHEIGHAFVGLGDEYVDPYLAPNVNQAVIHYIPNLDLTDDPEKVKWSAFLKLPAYKKSTGIFEGGYYSPTGVYRPAFTSVMRDNMAIPSYNAPSRLAIVKHIFDIIGKSFSMDNFIKNDISSITSETGTLPPGRPNFPINDFLKPEEKIKQLNAHPNL